MRKIDLNFYVNTLIKLPSKKVKKSTDSNLVVSVLECSLNYEELALLIDISKGHIKM